MNLYAVDASSGIQIWKTLISRLLRTRPAVGENAVYLVDESGRLSGINKVDGNLLWTSVEKDYEGAPLLVGNSILAAANGGVIYTLTKDGKGLSSISSQRSNPSLKEVDFRLGLEQGGDAVWSVDTKGYIWRFGPAWKGAQPLNMNWSSNLNTPPFTQSPFFAAPQVWHSRFIVVDMAGNIYQLDPQTGQPAFQGNIRTPVEIFAPD
jgi:outer membrane protein assembly factor BamB